MTERDRVLYTRVDSDMVDALTIIAKHDERPVSYIVRDAIRRYLETRSATT